MALVESMFFMVYNSIQTNVASPTIVSHLTKQLILIHCIIILGQLTVAGNGFGAIGFGAIGFGAIGFGAIGWLNSS